MLAFERLTDEISKGFGNFGQTIYRNCDPLAISSRKKYLSDKVAVAGEFSFFFHTFFQLTKTLTAASIVTPMHSYGCNVHGTMPFSFILLIIPSQNNTKSFHASAEINFEETK